VSAASLGASDVGAVRAVLGSRIAGGPSGPFTVGLGVVVSTLRAFQVPVCLRPAGQDRGRGEDWEKKARCQLHVCGVMRY